MGCDIHAHFEIKVDGLWIHHSAPILQRNYELFAKMAGMRGDDLGIEPISLLKGLPKNVSQTVLLDAKYWEIDGHSHSWLDAEEIREVLEFHKRLYSEIGRERVCQERWGYLYRNSWEDFLEFREDYPSWVEDIRLVFWFDN